MNSFFADVTPTSAARSRPTEQSVAQNVDFRCKDFLHFLAIALAGEYATSVHLHPVLTSFMPQFSDASMGGASFDVRKVTATSFPNGLADETFEGRRFVVVKQPRLDMLAGRGRETGLGDIAIELQVLRHPQMQNHEKIIDFLGIVYHNTGTPAQPYILPALVLEFAEFGNLESYQMAGFGRSINDKYDIVADISRGLHHLHEHGVIHGDVKVSNMLVCKHQIRGFVVKLSDFGFAISRRETGPKLVGFTPLLEAPEVHQPLRQEHLRQLDIYSYGLLFHAVMKNGTHYYETVPREVRHENCSKMKESNLLPATLQANLLMTMREERCLILIFCRIIAFSLQANPELRFYDMNDVIGLLDLCDPRDLSYEYRVNDATYQLMRMPVSFYQSTKDNLTNVFQSSEKPYFAALSTKMPMIELVQDFAQKRFEFETQHFLSKPEPTDTDTYQFRMGLNLVMFKSLLGVSPKLPWMDKWASSNSLNDNITQPVQFCQQNMPDISRCFPVIAKMNESVQAFIFDELNVVLETEDDDMDRISMTQYNLGFCHINAIKTDLDIDKGLEYLESAAMIGSHQAQDWLLQFYSATDDLDNSQKSTFVNWAPSRLQQNDKKQLRQLQQIDKQVYEDLCSRWRLERAVQLTLKPLEIKADSTNEGCELLQPHSWEGQFLHFAATAGLDRLARMMLERRPGIVNIRNAYGQTPLIVSCQSGNHALAISMSEHGADWKLQDQNGLTALHWLICFSDEEKRSLTKILTPAQVNVDACATITPQPDKILLNVEGGAANAGSALLWSTASGDSVAVEILMRLGADSITRPNASTACPLELACIQHQAPKIHYMLDQMDDKSIRAQYWPLIGPITINPLFRVLQSSSRFHRLSQHGMDFEKKSDQTIKCLINAGVACDSVLVSDGADGQAQKMTAPFVTALHHCNADLMSAGMKYGFLPDIDSTFLTASSGGPALSLAIAHKDRQMISVLLDAGASVTWRNMYQQPALNLAARESDDVWFVQQLLQHGAELDDTQFVTAFWTATYVGNLQVARYLWERGAKRDSRDRRGMTVLGNLVQMRTRNALRCIEFILHLPDREEGDGFVALQTPNEPSFKTSVLHALLATEDAAEPFEEDPDTLEKCRMVIAALIHKYSEPQYINSKLGPHHDVPMGMAVEIGNHFAVRHLLEAGADPNAEDEFGRRPLDKCYSRYCYPAALNYFDNVSPDDLLEIGKRLNFVNRNTSELMSLLKSYGAEAGVFRFPNWLEHDLGYRNADWVAARLQERDAKKETPSQNVSIRNDLPIRLPERPRHIGEATDRDSSSSTQDHLG